MEVGDWKGGLQEAPAANSQGQLPSKALAASTRCDQSRPEAVSGRGMRPGSLNLDLSAKEPSENQNSPAETGRQAGRRPDQCLGPARVEGGAANYQSRREDLEEGRGVEGGVCGAYKVGNGRRGWWGVGAPVRPSANNPDPRAPPRWSETLNFSQREVLFWCDGRAAPPLKLFFNGPIDQ